jgi:hypothetical protein
VISYTITVLQTVSPETSSVIVGNAGGNSYAGEPNNEVIGYTNDNAYGETAVTITQSNGNTFFSASTSSSFSWTRAMEFAGSENESDEGNESGAYYASTETNGRAFTGTALGNMVQTRNSETRNVTRTTGHSVITQATQIRTTQTTTVSRQAWSTTQEGTNQPSIYSFTEAVNSKTTGISAGSRNSTIFLTEVQGETGWDDQWPAYATATVLVLAPNEIAWVATTHSNVHTPIQSIAQSFAGGVTVLPSFWTYLKETSNLYGTEAQLISTFTASASRTFSAFSSQNLQAITVANTSVAKIPFQTVEALTQNVATREAAATWIGTYAMGGTRRVKTTSGLASGGVTASVTGNTTVENSYFVVGTVVDEAPMATTGSTQSDADEGAVSEWPGRQTAQGQTSNEYTGSNTQALGFTSAATFAPARNEQAFLNAAIAFGDTPGLNLDLPVEIEGGFSIAKLSEVAALPYPTSFTASVGGQAATVSIGGNVTMTRGGSTTSYDLFATGTAYKTQNIKAPVAGGDSPDGHTFLIGPGVYEAHYATGGSGTVSYSTQTIITADAANSASVTAYRALPMFLGIGENRYTVMTAATTATNIATP